jgi:hypothetical protein
MLAVSLLLCFLQVPETTLRAERSSPRTVSASHGPESVEPHPAVQRARQQRFQERFNNLVKAIEAFSAEYNRSEGQVWPHAKAEALRRAMEELQKADPKFAARK